MLILKGLCGTLKRVVWYIEDGQDIFIFTFSTQHVFQMFLIYYSICIHDTVCLEFHWLLCQWLLCCDQDGQGCQKLCGGGGSDSISIHVS